jgi:outer membrane protein TolC
MALAAAVLGGGCVHFEPKPLLPSRSADLLESRTLTNFALRTFIQTNAPKLVESGWPVRSWDLPLLTWAALYYHADIETARAKIETADAGIISAGARPNPTFSFLPAYAEPPLEFFSPWTLGFSLDVPIETMGKRGHRIAQARHLASSARLDLAGAAWQVRSRVRQALLDLYSAQQTKDVLTRQESVQKQTVQLLDQQLEAGEITFLEAQVVRVAADETTLQLRDAERLTAQARIHLADAIGLPVESLAGMKFSFGAFDHLPDVADSKKLRREALTNRPDILSALSDYEAAQSALQLEIAKQYPDIHLDPGYTWNEGVNNYALGFSLTLPVLDRNEGPIAEANARRRESAAAFTALQAQVMTKVDLTYSDYSEARRKLNTAASLVSSQQRRLEALQKQFKAGDASKVDLLQIESELNLTLLGQTSARIDAQQALGALEDAMQRPIIAVKSKHQINVP